MFSAAYRARLLAAPAALALVVALVGCASGAPADPAEPGQPDPAATVEPTTDPDAERRAAECVAGAWVAETPALQAFFDQALAEAGVSDYRLIAEGSIVYEFIEHGFGFIVIPTGFGMRMPTGFGDVTGTITGQVSGLWTVKGEYIHVAAEGWQNNLAMRWTFMGADFEVDTGMQELVDGLTDIDRFECASDELILQSHDGPPLALSRMVDVG